MNAQTTIHTAMAAAFAEIEGATKSANNPHFKSKYADLTAVIEAIKPALVNNDLFFTQRPHPSEGGITVETVLHHSSGEEIALGMLYVPANKNDAQAFGSALTYARRYALVTAFGVPVEDDDGNAAGRGQSNGGAVNPAQQSTRITEEQRTELMLLLDQGNVPVGEFLQVGNIGDLRELAADQFDISKRWIAKKTKEAIT